MIGLVIATHGNFGQELLVSVQMIIGPVRNARAVAINQELGLEEIRDAISSAVAEVGGDGHGVLVATDMFGGTPCNVSLALVATGQVDVLAGVNLPMLLKFFNSQESVTLAELTKILASYGRQSIVQASDYLQNGSAQ
ncbi:MAG: PTS sugar transporter subunit IIA [Desulfuromonadales bacterium]|nr:PTS sugar transporter subunit IIA [Desulfuromonadales bacterium]